MSFSINASGNDYLLTDLQSLLQQRSAVNSTGSNLTGAQSGFGAKLFVHLIESLTNPITSSAASNTFGSSASQSSTATTLAAEDMASPSGSTATQLAPQTLGALLATQMDPSNPVTHPPDSFADGTDTNPTNWTAAQVAEAIAQEPPPPPVIPGVTYNIAPDVSSPLWNIPGMGTEPVNQLSSASAPNNASNSGG